MQEGGAGLLCPKESGSCKEKKMQICVRKRFVAIRTRFQRC